MLNHTHKSRNSLAVSQLWHISHDLPSSSSFDTNQGQLSLVVLADSSLNPKMSSPIHSTLSSLWNNVVIVFEKLLRPRQ